MKSIFKLLFAGLLMGQSAAAQGTAQRNLNFSEQFIQLETGVKMQYVEQGNKDGIPVILLHGFSDSWHSFEGVLPHLPGTLHVFALSVRGHGNSSRPEKGYHPNDFSKDIAAFIRQKNLKQVVIVGHSMGSTIAQCFAVKYPELTRATVLVASFTSYSKPEITEFTKVINELKDPVDSVFVAEFQKSTIMNPIGDGQLEVFISESRKLPSYVWKGVAAGWPSSDFRVPLQSYSKPTLIVWGDKDAYCPREDQDILAKAIKNSRLVVYKGFGHALHWEAPQRFASDLVEFINRSEGSAVNRIKRNRIKNQVTSLSTGASIDFVEQGEAGTMPLILLHGIGDSWHSFDKVLQYLPSSIHVYALTQRGHGNSSKPASNYHPKDFAADVAAFMKSRGIKKAVIAGHSMGSVNALQFGLDYPQLVAGIVTIGSDAAFRNNPGMPEFYQELLRMSQDRFEYSFMKEFQKSTLAKPIDSTYFNLMVEEAMKVSIPIFREAFKGILDVDYSTQLKNLRMPLLAFWGSKDSFCGRHDQDLLVNSTPSARLLVYEGVGHALHWEEPKRFAEDLTAFFNSIEKN